MFFSYITTLWTLAGPLFINVLYINKQMPSVQVKALVLAQLRARRKANEAKRDQLQNIFADVVA